MTRRLGAALASKRLVLGVVHLLPLPGSPRFAGREPVLSRALADAERLLEGGADGFVVENFGDAPFYKDQVPAGTVAEMTALVERIRTRVGSAPLVGVNVLRNDATAALAVAGATASDFVRVNVHVGVMFTDQGTVEGRAHETTRLRASTVAEVAIVADVAVKHASPPPGFDLVQSAKDTAYRGLADALVVTGAGTGAPASPERLRQVRAAVPDRPLLVGSGVDTGSIAELLALADGVIVGTSVKQGGRVSEPVDVSRVRALLAAAGR
ncbi:MAG: BtpA/SgcQ family protein [Polyangiaceae bacterium]